MPPRETVAAFACINLRGISKFGFYARNTRGIKRCAPSCFIKKKFETATKNRPSANRFIHCIPGPVKFSLFPAHVTMENMGVLMKPAGNSGQPPNVNSASDRLLIYRQSLATRITHWTWAVCLFFLLLSGLQIFNAHPTLYFGDQSGFDFNNSVFSMTARNIDSDPKGTTTVLGHDFNTSGILGMSNENGRATPRGFPAWATIPSRQDLATGRVVHFFFAWLLVFTLFAWLVLSLANGHLRRDLLPSAEDLRKLPQDVLNHLRLRFDHGGHYNVLQKLSYVGVLLVMLPLMILTGLSMSPGMNAFMPWLVELFGGRQTARTIHFVVMLLLVLFFVVHILMVFAAGPINEMRSMVTGWYRRRQDSTTKPAAET
jgi:thiosulfate reductase cytochrome b subunit